MKAAILAVCSFAGVIVACFFLVAFTKSIPPPGEQFVAVGFADIGDVAEAAGEVESEVPSETVEEVVQPEVSQSEPVEATVAEEVVTQEQSEVSVPTAPEPVTEPDEMVPLWKILHLAGADWTYGTKGWAAENYCMFLADNDAWEHETRTTVDQANKLGCKTFLNTE